MVMQLIVISAFVEGRVEHQNLNQMTASSAVVSLSFWCLTRFTTKKYLSQRGEKCGSHSFIFDYVVYAQSLSIQYDRNLPVIMYP